MLDFLLQLIYKKIFLNIKRRNLQQLKKSVRSAYIPLFIRPTLAKKLKKEALNEDFFLGLWFFTFECSIFFKTSTDEEMDYFIQKIPNLPTKTFASIKSSLIPIGEPRNRFQCPSFFLTSKDYKTKVLSETLFLKLQSSLKKGESIALVHHGFPWNVTNGKLGPLYWNYLKDQDLGKSLDIWSYIVHFIPQYKADYLQFLDLALKQVPYSVILQTLRKKEALIEGQVTQEQVKKEKIEELFPCFNTTGLKRALFHSPGLYSEGQRNGLTYWDFHPLTLLHEVLKTYPKLNPSWFIKDNYFVLIKDYSQLQSAYKDLLLLLPMAQDFGDKINQSIIEAFLNGENILLSSSKDLIITTEGKVLKEMLNNNPTWTLSTLYKNLQKYHEHRPDLELTQPFMRRHHKKTFSLGKKNYEVIVPSLSQELIVAGKILKNCVGDGEYADLIQEGECEVFFITTNGKLTHCVEVEVYEDEGRVTQATRVKNLDMGQALLRKICLELDLEDDV